MRNDIKILKQKLIESWIEAFDEFDLFKNYEKETESVRFAYDINAYNLQNYKNGKIESDKQFFNQPPDNSYCEFGMNKDELPVVSIIFKSNVIEWIGFYKWNKNTVEYYEFCYATKIPSVVEKITINNAEKFYQSISLKERGDFPILSEFNRQEIIDRVLQYTYTFFDTKIYEYIDERIYKSYGTYPFNQIGEYAYEEVYTYNESTLTKIERFTENWPPQLIYIKPSGKTIEKLIDDLSNLLAAEIINGFEKEKIEEPIFNIQLNYHDIDNYWPYIIMSTDKEKNEAITNKDDSIFMLATPIANETLRENMSEELDEMFAEFAQYVQVNEDWTNGKELLIKTSILLTKNKLGGKIPVSNDFIVFATDWSLIPESDEIENVLIRCGANKKNVKQWRDLKWF